MSKLGLRSESGPFDWFLSDFNMVLECMENNFLFFMSPDNLKLSEACNKTFICSKYRFYCNHDIISNFYEEKRTICEKYKKRAKRFVKLTKEPTLFIRTVRNSKEIDYITQNSDYINSIIKKNNSSNQILYILINGMKDLPKSLTWFRISVNNSSFGRMFRLKWEDVLTKQTPDRSNPLS